MSGIIFFATEQLSPIVDFYLDRIGAEIRLKQPGCTILGYENMLFGFCNRDQTDTEGVLTFVHDDRRSVDTIYSKLSDIAIEEPHENEEYQIYQFFARDPDGRTVEIQTFLHETQF